MAVARRWYAQPEDDRQGRQGPLAGAPARTDVRDPIRAGRGRIAGRLPRSCRSARGRPCTSPQSRIEELRNIDEIASKCGLAVLLVAGPAARASRLRSGNPNEREFSQARPRPGSPPRTRTKLAQRRERTRNASKKVADDRRTRSRAARRRPRDPEAPLDRDPRSRRTSIRCPGIRLVSPLLRSLMT